MKKIQQRAPRAKKQATKTINPDAPIPLRPVDTTRPTREYLSGIVTDTVDRLALDHDSPPSDFEPVRVVMADVAALVNVARLAMNGDGGNGLHHDEIDRVLWLANRLLRLGESMDDAKLEIQRLRDEERAARLGNAEAAHA